MEWNSLLCPYRMGSEKGSTQLNETRSHFQRDYDRVVFSSPFRRLQNKTQVFPLPGSIFVHNRLTHSLEVASVGRSLGNNIIPFIQKVDSTVSPTLIEQIPTIVSTGCLAHDLGNPPFGHSGEDAIRSFFINNTHLKEDLSEIQWSDLANFEGNANALRLLTQKQEGKREGGFRLSFPVLGSIAKYPWDSSLKERKKFGFFQSEKNIFLQMAEAMGIPIQSKSPLVVARHPLVYLVEAADDICYQIMDIEDAHKLGILTTAQVKELLFAFFDPVTDKSQLNKVNKTLSSVTDVNEQVAFLRAITIGRLISSCSNAFENNYSKIMGGEMVPSLMEQLDERGSKALSTIRNVSFDQVYNHRTVVEIEIAGFQILGILLEKLCNAILNPKDKYSKKILQLIPHQYFPEENSKYSQLQSVVDFVSGMTDVFALEMYRTIQGISLPGVNR